MSTHDPLHAERLAHLRTQLKCDGLDGFVVPLSDAHLSEYVGEDAKRLEWLTGFAGSAGSAAVLMEKAAMFVDGRYTLQVSDQVDGARYSYENVPATNIGAWLAANAPSGAVIGYDAWLHTRPWVEATRAALAAKAGKLIAVARNPIDVIWGDRPLPSPAPAVAHELAFAGQSAGEKRANIAAWLKDKGCDAVVLSALDSVAWAFNMRGNDVAHTPVTMAFAIVRADGSADLFIAPEKVDAALRAHLGDQVWIHPYEGFATALSALSGKRVAVDPERSVAAIYEALIGAQIVEARDPCVLPKALKNATEIAGTRAAHKRDGAALTRFLHWLSEAAPHGTESELSVAERLEGFRRATNQLKDLSFDTISGSGPNGASPHYRVTKESSRTIPANSMYLVDSGGQYLDGTTDVTRTVWIGPDAPPAEERDRFTRVLKGHIALARAIFPQGTRGSALDTLARQHLWAAGLDYEHGTGHGVGSYLAVHEGPQRIAKSSGGQAGTEEPLAAGMIISNEPGYYKAGAYGIRVENLVLVEDRTPEGADGAYLGFETLTLAPIDRTLIDTSLMTRDELRWVDEYHARVLTEIGPQLDPTEQAWLAQACAPLD